MIVPYLALCHFGSGEKSGIARQEKKALDTALQVSGFKLVRCIVNFVVQRRLTPQRRAVLLYTSSDRGVLVTLELADALLHLLVRVDAEALVLGDAGQLHVLGVKLLLHDLLERAKSQSLGLLKG